MAGLLDMLFGSTPTRRKPRRHFSATGECKMVNAGRGGCKQQLCNTGKGATGWTFIKGTRRCPTGGTSGYGKTRRKAKESRGRRRY